MGSARRLLLISACCALACSETTIQTPSRNLDRPTDIGLVCMGSSEEGDGPTPVDPAACAIDPDAGLPSATLYGFVSNTSRGEVAVVNLSPEISVRLKDLDPAHPGFGFVPVGKLPERLAVSSDGCRVATANAGSCDLSLVDTTAALDPSSSGTVVVGTGDAATTRPRGLVATVVPRTARGPLGARPGDVVFARAGEPGAASCSESTADLVFVTFPRCGLVAAVELPGGRISQAFRVTAVGLVPVGDSPSCPVECTVRVGDARDDAGVAMDGGTDAPDGSVTDASPDAIDSGAAPDGGGAPDGGSAEDAGAGEGGVGDGPGQDDAGTDAGPAADASDGVDGAADDAGGADAPVTDAGTADSGEAPDGATAPGLEDFFAGGLAYSKDGTRLYVAAANQPLICAASVKDGRLAPIKNVVWLDATTAGIKRIRLSPGLSFGAVTQTFLYAFAGDRSVHVVLAQESRDGLVTDELVECETNPDPRAWVDPKGTPVPALPEAERGCVRLDTSPGRRPLATTPGIVPPSGVPKDVAFATVTAYQVALRNSDTPGPANLQGTFGWLALSRGTGLVVNVVPDREAGEVGYDEEANPYTLRPDPSLVLAHQLRNATDITAPVTVDTVGELGQNAGPPRVYAYARTATGIEYTRRDVFRLDEAHTSDGALAQSLSQVSHEGKSLYDLHFPDVGAVRAESWTFIFQGVLPSSTRPTGNLDGEGPALEDRGQVFCDLGAQPGDLLTLGGCAVDEQCGGDEICVADPTAAPAVTGLCYPEEEEESRRTDCSGFLRTLRQYRVTQVFADRLELVPSFEIRQLPGGCDPALGEAETERCNTPAPTDVMTFDPELQRYRCDSVPWHGGGECVRDCRDGRLCGEGYACDGNGRCVGGPGLTPESVGRCLKEFVSYALQAGDAFLVYGNSQGTAVSGYFHRMRRADAPDAAGRYECVDELDVTSDEVERQRLTLLQGRVPILPPVCRNLPPTEWPPDPNPCRVDGVDEEYYFGEEGSPVLRDGRAVKVYYANPVINAGFLVGRLDDDDHLVVNPPPSADYAIQVDIAGWFLPLGLGVASFLPETLAAGPDGYIYVIDSGHDISTSGIRGQLLRIDPVTVAIDPNFVVR